jgi:hypothetical protein
MMADTSAGANESESAKVILANRRQDEEELTVECARLAKKYVEEYEKIGRQRLWIDKKTLNLWPNILASPKRRVCRYVHFPLRGEQTKPNIR